MLLWFGGCPKRQGPASIVYVPASPPKALTAAPVPTDQEILVIEEPAPPPEPEVKAPAATTGPAVNNPGRRPARTAAPAEPPETASPDIPTTPSTEVPSLEPGESSAHMAELRQQVQKLQQDVRQRLSRLEGARLPADERRTLEDARNFLDQSTHAVTSGDLQRALNLARKAFLLLAALE
jgi:hypothetical protein